VAGPYQAVRSLKDGDLVKPGAVVTTPAATGGGSE
jgi:hypothetical protein